MIHREKILLNFNRVLQKLTRFELKKIPRQADVLPSPKKKNSPCILVEFVGPSGVGKSHLCDYYLNNHRFSFPKKPMTRTAVKPFLSFFDDEKQELPSLLDQLLEKWIARVSTEEESGRQKQKKIAKFFTRIKLDWVIQNLFSGKTIFLDEHLMRDFPDYASSSFEDSDLLSFWENRVFIFCTAPEEQLTENILKRQKISGKLIDAHQAQTYSELLELNARLLSEQKKNAEIIRNKGGKVLEINTQKDLRLACQKIDAFLEENL